MVTVGEHANFSLDRENGFCDSANRKFAQGRNQMVKAAFEIGGLAIGIYVFYRGLMGVSYETLNWFLNKMGYPED